MIPAMKSCQYDKGMLLGVQSVVAQFIGTSSSASASKEDGGMSGDLALLLTILSGLIMYVLAQLLANWVMRTLFDWDSSGSIFNHKNDDDSGGSGGSYGGGSSGGGGASTRF